MFTKTKTMVLMLTLVVLFSVACALPGCAREAEQISEVVIVATEPVVVEEPEATPTPSWSPFMVYRIEAGEGPIHSLAIQADDSQFIAGMDASAGNPLLKVDDGSEVGRIELRHSLESADFSVDGAILAAGLGTYGVDLIDPQNGETIVDLHRGFNARVAFSPDGSLIASSERGNKVYFWNTSDYSLIKEVEVPGTEWVTGVQFSPTRAVLAVQRWNCTVQLIDTNTFEIITALEHPGGTCQLRSIAFSPNGSRLAGVEVTLDFDPYIRIWCMDSLAVLTDLPVSARGNDVHYSPDGSLLAAGLQNNTIMLWSLPDYELKHQFQLESTAGSDWVTVTLFTPDSQHLLIGRFDGSVELWQVRE